MCQIHEIHEVTHHDPSFLFPFSLLLEYTIYYRFSLIALLVDQWFFVLTLFLFLTGCSIGI